MRKQTPPPVGIRLLDDAGNLHPQWVRWFQHVGEYYDLVRRKPDKVCTADATLTTDDYGKVVRFDNGASDISCSLPAIYSRDLYCWITIVRTGTGRLTIIPDSAARIEYGSLGGRFWCEEPKRLAANVTLQIMNSTQWGIIGATGIWSYR